MPKASPPAWSMLPATGLTRTLNNACSDITFLGDGQGEVKVGPNIVQNFEIGVADHGFHHAGQTGGKAAEIVGAVLPQDAVAVLSLAPPVARGGIKIWQAPAFGLVQEIIVALEKGGDHGLDIGFAGDGHIQETAGGQQAAHLVQGLVHGRLVQTGHRGLQAGRR